jgi:hypothetical protein
VFTSGAPNGAAVLPGSTGGIVPAPLAAGNAEATWLNAGAAEVQPWGIDNAPTAVPPVPDVLNALAPEPTPGLSTDPDI